MGTIEVSVGVRDGAGMFRTDEGSSMQAIAVNGLTLFFDDEQPETVELVSEACRHSAQLLEAHWGLATPQECRVYIMTSWHGFIFASAPWPWKALLALTLPLWVFRAMKVWSLAGGWQQNYGRRQAVGVKPPRLLQFVERRIGEQIFVDEPVRAKVQSVTCHELTHAFTAHLALPTWLHEGVALVAVDRFWEKPTVRYDTLARLARAAAPVPTGGRQKLRVGDEEALITLYVRAYWLTRYIEETRPRLLPTLLLQRIPQAELEEKIARAYGKGRDTFWAELDAVLVSHFKQKPVMPAEGD
jgi:hypothetical protein